MKNCDIIYALAQKVVDTIYGDWHHEDIDGLKVTHWMELPELPEAEEQ